MKVDLTIVLPEDPAKICIGSELRLVARFGIYAHGLKMAINLYKNNKGEYGLHNWAKEEDLELGMGHGFCSQEDKKWWIAKLVKVYEKEVANRPEEAKENFRKSAREHHKPGDYISTGNDYIYNEECEKINREAKEIKP